MEENSILYPYLYCIHICMDLHHCFYFTRLSTHLLKLFKLWTFPKRLANLICCGWILPSSMKKIGNFLRYCVMSHSRRKFIVFFLSKARVIFDKATKVNFRNVDDLASVWCEYSEMELRHELVKHICFPNTTCTVHVHDLFVLIVFCVSFCTCVS